MKLFCPRCGKDTDTFYDNVCRLCFIGEKKLIECPQVLSARFCPKCGSFFRKGKWQPEKDESEAIKECVKDALALKTPYLNTGNEARNIELLLSAEQLDYSRYNVHIDAKAEIKGLPVEASLDTEVRINWETCSACSRISGGYFEGIVQIRAERRLPTEEELGQCKSIAESVASQAQKKGDRLAFIAKTVELHEGVDIYVGSKKLGKQICRAIMDTFGGKLIESPKLVGQKNGEDVYRITYALRLPEFVRGDIISADGKVIEVQSCGKRVSGIDLETGKRFIENFSDIMEVKKLAQRKDAVSAVLIYDERNTIQVMHPDTYETIAIKRPEFLSAEPGDEIKIVKTAKGIYVLP